VSYKFAFTGFLSTGRTRH